MDHGGGMMAMMGGWMLLWALVGLAVLVLAVLGATWLARRLSPDRREDSLSSPGRPDEAPSAQELLRRRYAAGEIHREEYLRMQRDLTGG
jgi:putative membrane protein